MRLWIAMLSGLLTVAVAAIWVTTPACRWTTIAARKLASRQARAIAACKTHLVAAPGVFAPGQFLGARGYPSPLPHPTLSSL